MIREERRGEEFKGETGGNKMRDDKRSRKVKIRGGNERRGNMMGGE